MPDMLFIREFAIERGKTVENINESAVRQIVEQVLTRMEEEAFVKEKDPSGIIKIQTATVKCQPFGGAPGVYLKDIVDLNEAPRMGAGIMEIDHTSFEWTLDYDEYDMVISGVLNIVMDGRNITGQPGDIIYIPKGSHIHFQSNTKARYAYFVYPADWQK